MKPLAELPAPESSAQARNHVVAAVCRKSYIHPALIEDYLAGDFPIAAPGGSGRSRATTGLSAFETELYDYLQGRARPVPALTV